MSYPLTEKDVPKYNRGSEDNMVYCGVCGVRGDSTSVNMMLVNTKNTGWPALWVHKDICFNKWFLIT